MLSQYYFVELESTFVRWKVRDVPLVNVMRQEWFKLGCDHKKSVAFGKYVQIAQRI